MTFWAGPLLSRGTCHLLADSHSTLLSILDSIGIHPERIQHLGTPHEHVDIDSMEREAAMVLGAEEVDQSTLMEIIHSRKVMEKKTKLSGRGRKKVMDQSVVEMLSVILS